ncbi:MAG: hypothetical protein HC830_01450 [Bacteroidetes bacterium]|nr:hypothetical protein [Bacteroidales bacterium]NJO68102.1 hypothetical protein [Bacteroidota bacterium]
MNCNLCKHELNAYREGRLPEGIRAQVKAHLESCEDCMAVYNLETIADKVFNHEKVIQPNPFLSTRIMAKIETMEQHANSRESIPFYSRVVKPALISVSVIAAVYTGVVVGNVYQPASQTENIPVELTYFNDAALESVDLLSDN